MKNVMMTIIITMAVSVSIVLVAMATEHETHDGNGVVVCGSAYMYNMEGATVETVKEVETITSITCDQKSRTTNSYKNVGGIFDGKDKHVYYSKADKLCTINFELTPEAHMKAFKERCL